MEINSKSFIIVKSGQNYYQTPATINMKKSILKPCTLRRSMSMESNDPNLKKVAFSSPQCIVDVNFIDEKMKRSYIEDKEMLGHRRRSFTVPNNTNYYTQKLPIRAVPDFKALHEQEFKKMESLSEHAERKAERAKKLLSPAPPLAKQFLAPTSPAAKNISKHFVRNSETRTPIMKRPAIVPYVGPPSKIPKISSSSHNDVEKKRALLNSVNFVKKESRISSIFSKITGSDFGKANSKVSSSPSPMERLQLKGVRLNKRFELQMKHQQINPQSRL